MTCLFCSIANGDSRLKNPEDEIIDRCSVAYAKPGLGQFEIGYTLIIPNEHVLCMAELEKRDLDVVGKFVDDVSKALKELFNKPILIFEHGCGMSGSAGGCIQHAHLHLVPTSISLINLLHNEFIMHECKDLKSLAGATKEMLGYLYIIQDGKGTVCDVGKRLPSQYLRRVLCEGSGLERDTWDWRLFPFRGRIEEFIQQWHKKKEERNNAAPQERIYNEPRKVS